MTSHGTRRRGKEFAQSTTRRNVRLEARHTPTRVDGANGSFPVSAHEPKRPPIGCLYEELNGELRPKPRYGQFPRGLIPKLLPWLQASRTEIVHVCSGCLPRGEGIRVDIDPEAQPDVIADGRKLPFADGSVAALLIDPPYSPHYARELYGCEYPRPAHLLREAVRVVRPGGRIGFVHYITPKPPAGASFVRAFGLSTGFDMPVRAVTIYERDREHLPFEVEGATA